MMRNVSDLCRHVHQRATMLISFIVDAVGYLGLCLRPSRPSESEAVTSGTLDVHFISSLPVKQRSACTAWADTRPAQIV